MPSRKAERIVRVMRDEILSGKRAPGEKMPTYDAIIEQFGVTRPTVSRVLQALRKEGLVRVNGTRGVYVSASFPHHTRYLWVTSEQPGSLEWTSFLATILDLVERGETGITGEVIPLVGVDGRANNPQYQRLCEAVEHDSVAGLFLMNSATVYLLPALQAPGLPRVAIWAPLPHAALLRLDFEALLERACRRLLEKGRHVAVISPHAPNLARAEEYLSRNRASAKAAKKTAKSAKGAKGATKSDKAASKDRVWALHVAPVGCERVVELLFDRPDRPDAIFVTDDNLVEPLLAGLKRAKRRPGKDVYVLAHCNWPRPIGADQGVEHIGFDVREILRGAKESIDAQRAGLVLPDRVIPPRFAHELTQAVSGAQAGDACAASAGE